jgi:phosphate transport system permease protein
VATGAGALPAGERGIAPRSRAVSRARTERRVLIDRWAGRLVVLGGLLIIACILAILVVIVGEVYPLFEPSTATALTRVRFAGDGARRVPAGAEGFGVDEYRQTAYAVTMAGSIEFAALGGTTAPAPLAIPDLGAAQVSTVTALGAGDLLIGTSDARVIPLRLTFMVEFREGRRVITPQASFGSPRVLGPDRTRAIRRVAGAAPATGAVTVAQVSDDELLLQATVERKALIGPARSEESFQILRVAGHAPVRAVTIDARGEDLFVGTARGTVVRYDLRDLANPIAAEVMEASPAPITALGFLLGDRTLVIGDEAGGVSTWQTVTRGDAGTSRLQRIHTFASHAAPVVVIRASARDKGFVTADRAGGVHLSYGTSGQTLLELPGDRGDLQGGRAELRGAAFAPKGDGVLTADADGRIAHWRVENPHPEVSLGTLFARVWYEGYTAPDYVWQSTGGTDDFEPKLSLVPLVFGTLKGTFYALVVAVPFALLAALYVSEFMHPTLKGYVKPVVETMAALPSVVLGFLAGLWLAPMVERIVPGLLVLPVVVAVTVLLALEVWRRLPVSARSHVQSGGEVFVLMPVVVLAIWAAFVLGDVMEATLLRGDYRGWLQAALGVTYDQRNSLVVGIAMGFAVIPIIFTIAEDSLANVPRHLRAGSLALGATRWQTAIRVVLPTASPGIFSAIMIGFGRAVGETMIVLMATGNTPIMDWSPFNGFRALSANVAVELPEAPEGGTLFRVLFLAALLLFCLTFAVNTVAEVVRLRLRRRYRYL